MASVNTEVVDMLNQLTNERLKLELKKESANNRLQALGQEIATELRQTEEEIRQIDQQIWQVTESHPELKGTGKKSFVTAIAKFQFRDVAARLEVTDKKGLMDKARQIGVVRKIAKIKVLWELRVTKLLEFLGKYPEYYHDFEPFVEEIPEQKTLTIQPNDKYVVFHDGRRVSPPSIKINKS